MMRSGVAEDIAYSLSRWTDVSGTDRKWQWWQSALRAKSMISFDPETATPATWSLEPKDVKSLVFWTRRPKNLLDSRISLDPYTVQVNMTATGWHEVEHGTPSLSEAGKWLKETAVTFPTAWRFSPIPILEESVLLSRFTVLAEYAAKGKIKQVFTSFLQPNNKIPETRSQEQKDDLIGKLSLQAIKFDIQLVDWYEYLQLDLPENGLMTDPFTMNESCQMSCDFCYAVDQPKKHNSLKILR